MKVKILYIFVFCALFSTSLLFCNKNYNSEESQDQNNEENNSYVMNSIHVFSSSTLEEYKDINEYSVRNLFLPNNKFWSEGVKGDGIGEFIFIRFDDLPNIDVIKIKNGASISKKSYHENNRIKDIKLKFINCKEFTTTLRDEYSKFQEIKIPYQYTKNRMSLMLHIGSVYQGTKFDDTCISKIEFWYKNKKYDIKNIKYDNDHYDTFKEKFLFAINPTGRGYAVLVADKSENGFIVFDKNFCYINDKSKSTDIFASKIYIFRYKYKFDHDKLLFLYKDEWKIVKVTIHFCNCLLFASKEYNASNCCDFDHDITIDYKPLFGTYNYIGSGGHEDDDKRIGKLKDVIIPFK